MKEIDNDCMHVLKALMRESIVQIYAGDNCSFAVSKRGTVYAWGRVSSRLKKES